MFSMHFFHAFLLWQGLVVGGRAVIQGLRSAFQMNGLVVKLQRWDEATQRWIVSLPDASVKSIRPQNLAPEAAAEAAGPAEGPEAPGLDRAELQLLARQMLCDASEEVLDQMTSAELLELIHSLDDTDVSAGYAPGRPPEAPDSERQERKSAEVWSRVSSPERSLEIYSLGPSKPLLFFSFK